MIQSINGEYVNIPTYNLLSGSSYIELPNKLRNSLKDLINIKNNSNRCFLIILVSYQTLKTHPERIARGD